MLTVWVEGCVSWWRTVRFVCVGGVSRGLHVLAVWVDDCVCWLYGEEHCEVCMCVGVCGVSGGLRLLVRPEDYEVCVFVCVCVYVCVCGEAGIFKQVIVMEYLRG